MAEREVSGGAVAPAPAPMCANSCGFFGSAATKNLCSKCYKEHMMTKAAADAVVVAIDEKMIETAKTAACCVPDQLGGEDLDANTAAAAVATATPPAARAPTPTGKENANDSPFKALMLQLAEASDRRGGVIECANACGYFGCAATNNLCTLCYRDFLQSAQSAAPAAAAENDVAAEQPAAPKRCASCRKKVGLLGFPCRCGGTFCALHRYAEKHACGFDFKTAGREKIAKNNPLVVATKIDRI